MIGVLLAEDHGLVRAGLEHLLAAAGDIEVVAGAADGEEAVRLAAEHRPDVVLMDLSMPGVDGVEATRRIVAADPTAKVVVLTSFGDRERIIAALDAGAIGYLLKDLEPHELFSGVRAAARGESPIAPRAATELLRDRSVVAAPSPPPAPSPAPALSRREREVLGLVAEGQPNKLIARRLGVSEKTVKAHLTNIFRRIGVTDRTQAALWAREHGLRAAG